MWNMMAGSHNAFSMSLVSSLGNVLPRAKEIGFGPSVETPVGYTRHGNQNTLIALLIPIYASELLQMYMQRNKTKRDSQEHTNPTPALPNT